MKYSLDQAAVRAKSNVHVAITKSGNWLVSRGQDWRLCHNRDEARAAYRELVGDTRAVTALEYALIASLVAVAIIGSVTLLGQGVSAVFSTVANTI